MKIPRITSIITTLSLIAGCVKTPLKKNIQLTPLNTATTSYKHTIDNITLCAHKLSKKECKQLLGKNPAYASVIQLSITNASATTWEFAQNYNGELPLLSNKNAGKLFLKKIRPDGSPIETALLSVPCGAGIGCVGFLMGMLMWGVSHTWGPLAVFMTIASGTAIMPPVAVKLKNNTIESSRAHVEQTLPRLSPKVLTIRPQTTQSLLLFVDGNELPESFGVTVHEVNVPTNSRTFTVQL